MRSLIFGEDFTSDPVSKALSLGLRAFTAGQIQVDVAQLSQVGGPSWPPWQQKGHLYRPVHRPGTLDSGPDVRQPSSPALSCLCDLGLSQCRYRAPGACQISRAIPQTPGTLDVKFSVACSI